MSENISIHSLPFNPYMGSKGRLSLLTLGEGRQFCLRLYINVKSNIISDQISYFFLLTVNFTLPYPIGEDTQV